MVGDLGDVKTIEKLIQVLNIFRQFNNEMPLQQLVMYLKSCTLECPTVKELGEATGVTGGSRSRNMNALSEVSWRRTGKGKTRHKGHGLVKLVVDDFDMRYKRVELTPKGERTRQGVLAVIGGIYDNPKKGK